MKKEINRCILFDWGDTLMRDFPEFNGPMFTWPRVEVLPDACEITARLHTSWIVGLATKAAVSEESDIRMALERVGLNSYLDKIYCFRKIGHKKPSPDFFKYILEDLGMTSGQVIMVGDNFQTDVLGANNNGIRAVWFNEKSKEVKKGQMYRTIHDLKSLPEILKAFPIRTVDPEKTHLNPA